MMKKRYNKSESRKEMPYNKSKKRRAHPPYDQPRERVYREREVQDELDFEIQLPTVDWELPTLPDNTPQIIVPETTGIEVAPLEDQSEIVVEAPKSRKRLKPTESRLQPKPKTKTQQRSQGGKGQSDVQRRIQELQNRQQQQTNPNRKGNNNSINPGAMAVMGPVVFLVVIMVIAISNNVPPFFLMLIALFFGSQIWAAIKGKPRK